MKIKLFAAAAAVVCLAAGSAFAADGSIEASYVGINNGTSFDAYSVGGAASTGPVAGGWDFQGDASYLDGNSIGNALWAVQGAAIKRSSSNAYGAYVTYSDALTKAYEGGLLGELYQSNATLGLSVGYGSADIGPTNLNYWRIAGGATFYANDNLSLGINGIYQDVDIVGELSSVGISGEWKPAGLPVSFVASYDGVNVLGTRTNVYSVGVRHSFGGKSLKARDQGSLRGKSLSAMRF